MQLTSISSSAARIRIRPSASPTAKSPRWTRTAGSAREEIDATGLLDLARRDRRARAFQRARPHRLGRLRDRLARVRGGRHDDRFRHAAQLASAARSTRPSFDAKRAAAEREFGRRFRAVGRTVPGNLDQLEDLARPRGHRAQGVHVAQRHRRFSEGRSRRRCATGMKRAAELGLLVAVHAETITTRSRRAVAMAAPHSRLSRLAPDRDGARSHPARARLCAGETGCALHIVHVSSAAGVALIARGAGARAWT